MKSMTGYGSARRTGPGFAVTVEFKSVNHGKLEVRVHGASQAGSYAAEVEELVRKEGGRGRVEAWIKVESEEETGLRLDKTRAAQAYQSLVALRDDLCPGEPVPFAMLSAVPQLFTAAAPGATPSDAVGAAIREAAKEALASLAAMQAQEGAALEKDFVSRVGNLRKAAQTIAARSPQTVQAYADRLRARVAELLTDTSAPVDDGRLERETVMFADRIDITEELVRLEAHCAHFLAALRDGDDALGKRLEFLLQEMGREVNTTGSKSLDTDIAHIIVEMKVELARMREQVQNIL